MRASSSARNSGLSSPSSANCWSSIFQSCRFSSSVSLGNCSRISLKLIADVNFILYRTFSESGLSTSPIFHPPRPNLSRFPFAYLACFAGDSSLGGQTDEARETREAREKFKRRNGILDARRNQPRTFL